MSIAYETRGMCHILTMCNEKALNALTLPMIQELHARYRALEALPPHSAVAVLQGSGPKAFCAGGDVVSIVKDTPKGLRQEFFYEEYRCDLAIHTLPQFHVAILDGIVMGGGVGVSVHGRYRVATEKTLFAMPETAIGLFPDVGGSYFLPRLREKHWGLGRFLGLTGYRLRGADALHAGIATHYIPSSKVPSVLDELAGLTDLKDGENVTKVLNAARPQEIPPFSLEPHLRVISRCFESADSVEEVMHKLDVEETPWANEVISNLNKMCPLSLCVTFELMRRGNVLKNLRDVLQMEYMATQRFMTCGEFDKGVTELLITKTGQPKWNPSTIGEVTRSTVEEFFKPTPGVPTWNHKLSYSEAAATLTK